MLKDLPLEGDTALGKSSKIGDIRVTRQDCIKVCRRKGRLSDVREKLITGTRNSKSSGFPVNPVLKKN